MLEDNAEWIECSNVGNILGSINVSFPSISFFFSCMWSLGYLSLFTSAMEGQFHPFQVLVTVEKCFLLCYLRTATWLVFTR